MNFSFWWFSASDELASDELASDDVITLGALCLQENFDFSSSSLQMLKSFLFYYFFALSFVLPEPINDLKIFVYGPMHLNKY